MNDTITKYAAKGCKQNVMDC